MGLSGKLETMPIADLIQFLGMGRKTGMLVVRSGNYERKLWFEEGVLVSSRSDDPQEYLGQFLLQLGIVDEGTLGGALRLAERQKRPLGAVMIAGGLLTEDRLKEILVAKCYETIYNLFLWEKGTFEFLDGERIGDEHMRISMECNSVLMEGAYRIDQWKVIRDVFPTDDVIVTRVPGVAIEEDEDIEDAAKLVYRTCGDAPLTIGTLCMNLHRTKFWVYNNLLELKKRRAIRISQVEPAEPPEFEVRPPTNLTGPSEIDRMLGQFGEAGPAMPDAAPTPPPPEAAPPAPPQPAPPPPALPQVVSMTAEMAAMDEEEPEFGRKTPPPQAVRAIEASPIDLGDLDVEIQLVAEGKGGAARGTVPPAGIVPPAPTAAQSAIVPPPPPPPRSITSPPANAGTGVRAVVMPPPPPPRRGTTGVGAAPMPAGRGSQPVQLRSSEAIAQARDHAAAGRFEPAFQLLRACLDADAGNAAARDALSALEWDFQERVLAERFTFMSIPKIVKPLGEILKLKLLPAEAFLLSRINASTDVGSIIAISPLKKLDALLALCKLLDQQIIVMLAPPA